MRRFRAAVAVYGVLELDGHTLLMRRAGSGYHDGELSLPAGHLDGGEHAVGGLIRELREELDIRVVPAACSLATVAHRAAESPDDWEYVDLVFRVAAWTGEPAIAEPDRCSELVWADRSRLPADVIPYVATILDALDDQRLLLVGW